jgi:SagB-type dehydrogenase family enzyme
VREQSAVVSPTVWVRDLEIDHYALDSELVVADFERTLEPYLVTTPEQTLSIKHRPQLTPGARFWLDNDKIVISLPLSEPHFRRTRLAVRVRRVHRTVLVQGDLEVFWRVIEVLDGRPLGDLLDALGPDFRTEACSLINQLVETGVLEARTRPVRHYIHQMTKKGSLPAGDLNLDGILRLVTDGQYRRYPRAKQIKLTGDVPETLEAFTYLTAARRSYRNYNGRALEARELGALLISACGVTGSLGWDDREVLLRAYPSSGGLYAVEVYPVVFNVAGLESGLYHYSAADHALELISGGNEVCSAVLDAALPSEREMLGKASVMICLTAVFTRHEAKYGEGGYRMLIAEAGHLSQDLLLATTALKLDGRPFGGVFDDMLNNALGWERDTEEFLLSVLVGHAGPLS